jgi:hypothetical protein
MFEKEIEEYERIRKDYQALTAMERMTSELAQKRKNSRPLLFF